MISGSRQPTINALMPTLAQGLGYACPTETSLRRATRINLHDYPASFFRFAEQFVDEGRPSGIIDGLGEHSRCQAFDIQIFDGNQAVLINQRPRYLMVEISALV